jgi:molecular chaperone HscA
MVNALANRSIRINGKEIRLVPALKYPKWLKKEHPTLEQDYPRIAVSLGGARKRMIKQGGASKVTAGGTNTSPIYDDPKYRW